MVFQHGDSLQAVRQNQLDRRTNGVVDFEPWTHTSTTGPLAVTLANSSTEIALDINAGTGQVAGQPHARESTQAPLEANATTEWRADVVYMADSGAIDKYTGGTGDNTVGGVEVVNGEPQLTTSSPTGSQMLQPEPNDTRNAVGLVLAVVTVPPGASTSGDLVPDHIDDYRRPAIEPQPLETGTITFERDTLPIDEEREAGFVVPDGHAVSLLMVSQSHYNEPWDPAWNVRVVFAEDNRDTGSGISSPYSTTAEFARDDPLGRIRVEAGAGPQRIVVEQQNNGETDFTDLSKVGAQASYRIDPLENLPPA